MNINELARITGFSSATISRVINNSGYVKEETRKTILEAIERYNYIPSAVARSLSKNETLCIGVVVPDIENEFFSSIIRGIADVAEKNGYNIFFFDTDETLRKEHSFLKVVESQRLEGLIITPVSEEDPVTKEYLINLKKKKIPVVVVDRDISGLELDGVFVDNFSASYEGVVELIKNGHKKIATISGPLTSKPGKERFEGYIRALKDHNIPIVNEYIMHGDFKVDSAYHCTKKLFELPQPPTAIFTSNNFTTLGCLKYINECGNIRIGRDISLLGFDDIYALKAINYKISVICRDAKKQGMEAMRLLLEQLRNKDSCQREVKKITIPYKLIMRGSEKLSKL